MGWLIHRSLVSVWGGWDCLPNVHVVVANTLEMQRKELWPASAWKAWLFCKIQESRVLRTTQISSCSAVSRICCDMIHIGKPFLYAFKTILQPDLNLSINLHLQYAGLISYETGISVAQKQLSPPSESKQTQTRTAIKVPANIFRTQTPIYMHPAILCWWPL